MSLCDRCYDPGRCCRSLMLSTSSGATLTTSADEDPVAALRRRLPAGSAVPFCPVEEVCRTSAGVVHRWGCTALADDGRCTIYDRRPELCRAFEAGSDPLCAHFTGAEGGPL